MSMASSSSVILESKYDVFLSFKGEDTRHNFTGHLYAALCQKQISAFIDDDGLKKGDGISPAILKAIEESKLSVVIFSKNYASSSWCLDEIAKIIECKNMHGQIVLPIFYYVDASDVRKQAGSFEDAFRKHEESFKGMPERVQRWRAALTAAAGVSGWDSTKIRSESKLVDEIVRDILQKLNAISPLSDNKEDLVGIESRIDHVKSLLSKSKVVGIWGMAGIGKTTIAAAVYKQISRQFNACCFIGNIREELKKCSGQLVHLQETIMSRILGEGNHVIDPPYIVPQSFKNRLQCIKVLIVLDDVNSAKQLKLLLGGLESFGVESKIIVTTRDKQVLSSYGVNSIYKVAEFNYNEALLLFSKHAFKQNHPPRCFKQLSNMILEYAKGNPLALEVLGSSLYGKSKEEWESVMQNLEMLIDTEILDLLKISFDGLSEVEKNIFLDIACFFKGENKDYVVNLLKGYYKPMPYCLRVLMDKSLINLVNDELQMHDLLQEMAQQIVYNENKKEPGKRSRLWHHEDIYDVLKHKKGTDIVEGISLDMSETKEIYLSSRAFVSMVKLRLLKFFRLNRHSIDSTTISKVHLPHGLKYLPAKLKYLHWEGYPLKTLPSKFCPENLVALELPHSKIKQLWKKTKRASNLKLIDVHGSKHLIEFPNLLNSTKLEVIKLGGCQRLLKVPSSIQHYTNLRELNMRHCYRLRDISRNIHFTSPISIDLSDCISLKQFPQISGNVEELNLSNTAIKEVPTSISSLTELVKLEMIACRRLKRISTSICKLRSLWWLDLSGCSNLKRFPRIMKEMKYLEFFNLSGTAIKELPSSIGYLNEHKTLQFEDCENLLSLPSTIKQLSKLDTLNLRNCSMLQSIPELPLSLSILDASDCRRLHSLLETPTNTKQSDEVKFGISEYMKYDFRNCLNLNHNISQQRIEHLATALELFHGKANKPPCMFHLPGSEIPAWFTHQSFGSSITIEIPQYCCKRRLLGFAVSVIITSEKRSDKVYFSVCSNFSYCNFYGGRHIPFNSMKSDHLVIGFSSLRLPHKTLKGKSITIDFEIRSNLKKIFKCWGVCPIYEESNMVQSNTSIQRFAPTNEDLQERVSLGGVGRSNEEEEPNPKKSRRNQINSF